MDPSILHSFIEGSTKPSPTHLGAIWGELDAQINPFIYVLTIPGDIFRSLEPAAKDWIVGAFM
jgi:hypothetical protein